MTWALSPYAEMILQKREDRLKAELAHNEIQLSNMQHTQKRNYTQKHHTDKVEHLTKTSNRLEEHLEELWEPPAPYTMNWADALNAIWAEGRKHYNERTFLLVMMNPQTLKTAERKEVDLRHMCIFQWKETLDVDEIIMQKDTGEPLAKLIVPSKTLNLNEAATETYQQFRLDGMKPEHALNTTKIILQSIQSDGIPPLQKKHCRSKHTHTEHIWETQATKHRCPGTRRN